MTDTLSKLANPKSVLSDSSAAADHREGMSYLETLPRRLITLYLPLAIILIVLLFPFYWMALTAIKPDEQLLDMERVSPFWTWTPTLKHIDKLLFDTQYPRWLWNTMLIAV
ncbi:MAG TPA: carbohydrate ABC transporter permease, partial [Bradyrhizobium sp.]